MKILAHRGFWLQPEEKNSYGAFERARQESFGIETDFRDFDRSIVVSHDPANREALLAPSFFNAFAGCTPLAINVKADGLANLLLEQLQAQSIEDYFVFDMSIPETIRYLDAGLRVFLRVSEFEQNPPESLLKKASGIWLDYFGSDGWTEGEILDFLGRGLQVCIVSPELHRRPHEACWERILRTLPTEDASLMLCTDFPTEFRQRLTRFAN